MNAPEKKYDVVIRGYAITSPGADFSVDLPGIIYKGMDYGQIQVVQGMFLDFASRLLSVGDALMTSEQKKAYGLAVKAGTGDHDS